MVLPIRVIINGNLWVALGIQKLGNNIRDLLKVAFSISWGVVRWGEPRSEFIGVGCMISPWWREADFRRKVWCSRQPVKADHFVSESKSAECSKTHAPLTAVPPPTRQPAKLLTSLHHQNGFESVNIDSQNKIIDRKLHLVSEISPNNPGMSNLVSYQK